MIEGVTSWELGYKGQLGERVFVTLGAYHSRFSNFVTDLLPGVNPTYPPWTAPTEVPQAERAGLEAAVRAALAQAGQPLAAAGLTRLWTGNSAIVVSFGNAGRASASGVEVAAGLSLNRELRLDGNYSLFTATVHPSSSIPGTTVLPNTPKHKVNVSVAYVGRSGFTFRLSGRAVSGYTWASGIFVGPVPASQTVDLALAYPLSRAVRIRAMATDLLDQKRYHIYGGSVIGRRVLGGFTLTF